MTEQTSGLQDIPLDDEYFIALAIREAEQGTFTTMPNPRVGCILVKDDIIISRGFHQQTGHGHAEANALAPLGGKAEGATAYVTMEPCSYHGRTPSCAEALVKAGVKRVVCAMTDPHPKNQGLGFDILRAAGIEVIEGILESSSRALNPGHIAKFDLGRPYVRLKLACSLDGKTALANGESKWITGAAARADVQRLRARSSAIVTGIQTVVDDNPSLNVRQGELDSEHAALAASVARQIVVLDPQARIPADAKLLSDPNLLLMTLAEPANEIKKGVNHVAIDAAQDAPNYLDITAVLAELAARDCNEVLFECGATLAASVLQANLVDEIVIYMAPKLMGPDARGLLNLPVFSSMNDLPEFDFADVRMVGRDLRVTLKPRA